MADTEEPQFSTLAERIAALNKQKNFSSVGTDVARKKAPPPPPPPSVAVARPAAEGRSQTTPAVPTNGPAHQTNPQLPPRPSRTSASASASASANIAVNTNAPPPLPRRDTQTSLAEASNQAQSRPGPPPLPSRTGSFQSSPALPPRRASSQAVSSFTARRNSASSEASQQSAVSSLSLTKTTSSTTSHGSTGTGQRKLPPAFDSASLPPLPPTKRELEAKAKEAAAKEATAREPARRPTGGQQSEYQPSPRPSLPPRLPSRPGKPQSTPSTETTRRALPPLVGLNGQSPEQPPRLPTRPKLEKAEDAPPPVPVASRPSAAQIQAASVREVTRVQTSADCLVCRDWSGPDGVAAQYPRESLPRNDPIGHLARGLCDPFPSYTDKARAIFTWFHHNVSYDAAGFFNKSVKPQTPEGTILYGMAVCEGYAKTYNAIANRAGLDCVVVGGHGKGYGYTPLKKGERPPPEEGNHAWNAVRIDGGEWKLLDACWGAGHLCTSSNLYKKEFHPAQFSCSNDKFGQTHFPTDSRYQYRNDGRIISWEEYYIGRTDGEPPIFYGNGHQEGIAEDSVQPAGRQIPVNSGQVVRFQFSKLCKHWTSEKHGLGKPPLLLLQIQGPDGRESDMVPMETDGYWHWVDVHARDLGAPGQVVQVVQVTLMDGKDARGMSAQDYLSRKGKPGSSAWAFVMRWELV